MSHKAWTWLLQLLGAMCAIAVEGEDQGDRVRLREVESSRPFLRLQRPAYRNFAREPFENYDNHTFPYSDTRKGFFGSMGEDLIRGYELYNWTERRSPGLQYGSTAAKDLLMFRNVIDHLVVARDGYGSWGYSAIVGDALIARFTPLTLSMTTFNGARFDLSMPRYKLTLLGSRIEKPVDATNTSLVFIGGDPSISQEDFWFTFFADASVMLLGGRLQADLGNLSLGLNGANVHIYQSTRSGGGLKGVLHPQQFLMDYVVVRFSDDSPRDGRGGPAVHQVQIAVNGHLRPEIRPQVIRHRRGVDTQVGSFSRVAGGFRKIPYNLLTADRGGGYYRATAPFYFGRIDRPLYADFLYRLDHEAGVDVSNITNLDGLLANFKVESAAEILQVDGDGQLVYIFDLSREPLLKTVEIEALVGNDYHIEVATLAEVNPRAVNRTTQLMSTFYRTVLRAPDNVQDLSNLRRVRFHVGEQTGLFTYSVDMQLKMAGMEIQGEFARSALFSRFPARMERRPIFNKAPSFLEQGSAYNINATRWFGGWRLGGEYFAINPDFQTTLRAFQPIDFLCCYRGRMGGVVNETMYWDLVQDNEDADPFPDRSTGDTLGFPENRFGIDRDGIFVGQDEDGDGILDANRNFNGIPDYEEPFLMYHVEPNAYAYGLDRNNNDEPDRREDDVDWDYPYDFDQHGLHLFGEVDLSRFWSFGVGHYGVEEVAGPGRNKATYALLTYQRQGVERLGKLFFESRFRRVQDDIADEYNVVNERTVRAGFLDNAERGVDTRLRPDPLFYQDSYVHESYLEGRANPWSTLRLAQKLRLRLNWQQGGSLHPGIVQRQRRLDHWTVVSQAEYTWYVGKLSLTPQFKFLLLRLRDRDAGRNLFFEWSVIPIVKAAYPLLARTWLQTGLQGLGPLPYRFRDQVAGRNSFERRTAFVTLVNRTRYFGYDLYSIVGIDRDRKDFDSPFQQDLAFDAWRFFVRALVGFTEYAQPI